MSREVTQSSLSGNRVRRLFSSVMATVLVVATLTTISVVATAKVASASTPAGSVTSSAPLYTPGNFFGGTNPSVTCYSCQAAKISGAAPPSESLNSGDGVDSLTGDFTTTNALFSASALGSDLSLSLTYDAQLAQSEISSGGSAGPFGWGWYTNTEQTASIGTDSLGTPTITIIQATGAQVVFTQSPSGGTSTSCVSSAADYAGDGPSALAYTTGSGGYFCALASVQARVGYVDSYNIEYDVPSKNLVEYFSSTGQLAAITSIAGATSPTFVGVSFNYGVTPGSIPSGTNSSASDCPVVTGVTQCTIIVSGDGRDTVEGLNSSGQVVLVLDPSGTSYTLSYDSSGDLTSVTDYANTSSPSTWSYVYDTAAPSPNSSDLIEIYDPDSGVGSSPSFSSGVAHSTSLVYDNTTSDDAFGMVTSITDGTGATTTYSYSSSCTLSSCVASTSTTPTTTVSYPAQVPSPGATAVSPVEVEQFQDGVLISTTMGSATNPEDSETWSYNWTVSPSTGSSETINYPQTLSATATSASLTMDTYGDVTSTVDALGNATTSYYSATGSSDLWGVPELIWSYPGSTSASSSTPPTGAASYTYNVNAQVLTATDPMGNVTNFGYYYRGGMLCYVAEPSVSVSGYAGTCTPNSGYPDNDSVATPTSGAPTGATVLSYDAQGDLVSSTQDYNDSGASADPQTSTASFDVMNNELWSITPAGQSGTQGPTNPYASVSTYTPAGQVATSTPVGEGTTTNSYDLAGNAVGVVSPSSDSTSVVDGDNRTCYSVTSSSLQTGLTCSSAAQAGSSSTTFVPGSTTTATSTDARGDTTSYYYAELAFPSSPTEVVDSLGTQVSYSAYDDWGNVCVSGSVAPSWGTSTQCSTLSGDTSTTHNALGSETSVTDPSGNTTSYSYADSSYPTMVTSSTNPLSATTSETYNTDGQLVTTTNPDGTTITNAYDADGRSTQLASQSTSGATQSISNYVYNNANERSSMIADTLSSPPAVSLQPASQSAPSGTSATFSAAAIGATSVQWSVSTNAGVSFSTLSGATSSTLTLATTTSMNANEYEATFTNAAGSTTTAAATLYVASAPSATISSGTASTCVVLNPGTSGGVECWGSNADGQLGNGTTTNSSTSVPVSGLSGATQVAVGEYHACALLVGGSIECWGENNDGQLGNGTTTNSLVPVVVSGLTNAVQISLGQNNGCALTSAGSVECWGLNNDGQLGNATTTNSSVPVSVSSLSNVVQVSTGTNQSCAVLTSGAVKCWGYNNDGQLGNGTTTNSSTPVSVSALSGASVVAAGQNHACAQTSGTVQCWGYNNNGQLGNGTTTNSSTPVSVSSLSGASVLSAEGNESCAVVSGALKCWGYGNYGELGNGGTASHSTPVSVSSLTSVTQVSVGEDQACALSGSNYSCWGLNSSGQLGNGTTTNSSTPVTALVLSTQPLSQTVASGSSVSFVTATNVTSSAQWYLSTNGGTSYSAISGATSATYSTTTTSGMNGYKYKAQLSAAGTMVVTAVATLTVSAPTIATQPASVIAAAGETVPFSVSASGATSMQWNVSTNGGVSFSAISGATSPTYSLSASSTLNGNEYDVVLTNSTGSTTSTAATLTLVNSNDPAVSTGADNTCAIVNSPVTGSVDCWGANANGELGNSTTTGALTPVLVPGIFGAVQVSTSGSDTCALLANETIQCWGANTYGALGDGSFSGSASPVEVSGVTNAVSLSVGAYHVCALLSSSSVECWGRNTYGELGNGSTTSSDVPVSVSGLSGVIALSAGDNHSCAVLSSGGVQCWGYNAYGQLGNNSTTNSSVPVSVSGISMASAIALGWRHSCALLSSGGVQCWGFNASGQLGNASTTSSQIPVSVSGITAASSLAVGGSQGCASLSGVIKCWGLNSSGQLGNNTYTSSNVPVSVSGISTAVQISTGDDSSSCEVDSSSNVKCWGNNTNGQVGDSNTTSVATPQGVASIVLTSEPSSSTVLAGVTATFSVGATGVTSWQWEVSTNGGTSFTPVPGATSSSYSLTATSLLNANEYEAVATNASFSATSYPATLSVPSVVNPTTSYTYQNGQLASTTDSNGTTVSYLYATSGQVACVAYPVVSGSSCGTTSSPATGSASNTIVTKSYDSAGRLSSLSDWLGNTISYSYSDAFSPGSTTAINYATPSATVSATYGYDNNANMTSLSVGSSIADAWTYNADNQVATTSINGSTSSAVSYNPRHQITGAANLASSTSNDTYTVAANGQINQDAAPSGATTSNAYNAGGELCWSANVAVSSPSCSSPPSASSLTSYTFTTNGERASATTTTGTGATTTNYAWNALGELCGTASSAISCASAPTTSTTYTYNPDGLRMSATASTSTSSSTTASTWDTLSGGSIPLNINDATTASSSTTNTSYLYGNLLCGGTAPVEQISGSTAKFIVANQTGVQGVYSSSGSTLEMALYSVYGLQTISSGTDQTAFGFQGSYTDATGLMYLINRYYDAATQQFMSIDPWAMISGQPYVFTGDNPLNITDPLGLCHFWDAPCLAVQAAKAIAKAAEAAARAAIAAAKWVFHETVWVNNEVTSIATSTGKWILKHPLQVAIIVGLTASVIASGGTDIAFVGLTLGEVGGDDLAVSAGEAAAANSFNAANGTLKALSLISAASDTFACAKGPTVAKCAAAALAAATYVIAPPVSLAGSAAMKAMADNRTVLSAIPGNVSTLLDLTFATTSHGN